jgi:hypothetical protein
MQIRVRKKQKLYAQVHRNLLFNQSISVQSKAIGAIIECYSDNFEVSAKSLSINANIHTDTLRKYVKELEKNFYLYRIQIPKDNFKSIWFFDSEMLDFNFVFSELENIKKSFKYVILSGYEIFGCANSGTVKLAPYKNTTYSDMEILKMLAKIDDQKDDNRFTKLNEIYVMFQMEKEKEIEF